MGKLKHGKGKNNCWDLANFIETIGAVEANQAGLQEASKCLFCV
jgi:hypothetical protein